MPDGRLRAWLERNAQIFDQLRAAVAALADSAVQAGRTAEQHGAVNTAAELEQVTARAARLLAVVRHAQALEPIPDPDARRHFTAALACWEDAATTIAAAGGRDLAELARGARAGEAGTNEFLRSAAALRRATGHGPDPSNPPVS